VKYVHHRIMHAPSPAAAALAAILAVFSGKAASSQTAATTRIIVPYVAGGGTDILARLLAEEIGRAQGQRMLIENRPGAGSAIGTETVSRAAPDGNTVLIVTASFLVIPQLRKVNYHPLTSFEPICDGIVQSFDPDRLASPLPYFGPGNAKIGSKSGRDDADIGRERRRTP